MKGQFLHFFVFFLLFLSLSSEAGAQEQRFRAALVAGLNAAQIRGDASAGYNKLGLRGGLRGIVLLTNRTEASIDILFSQRGAQTERRIGNVNPPRTIQLDYIEVPIMFHLKDWLDDEETYYRVTAHGGLSFGRLFRADAFDISVLETEVENFAEVDISFTLGATYHLSDNFGLSALYTRSFNRLYDNRDFTDDLGIPRFPFPLLGFFLTFQGVYTF